MNRQTKVFLKSFLINGILFTSMMAGYDYKVGEDFNIWRFLFRGVFFGTVMAILTVYANRKQQRNLK